MAIVRSKSVEFKIYAPQAKKVFLSGSFNGWNTKKLPAKKDLRGNWLAKASLNLADMSINSLLTEPGSMTPSAPAAYLMVLDRTTVS